MDRKRQKEELYGLYVLYGFFTTVLALVDIFYSAWAAMPLGLKGLAFVSNLLTGVCFALILIEWEDPKYDKLRKYFFGFFIVSLALVAGFRVAKNEFKMFQDDVNKAKQEQAK
jgi:hypothetical protein